MHRIDGAEKSHFQCIYYLIFRCSFAAVANAPFSVFHFCIFSLNVFHFLFFFVHISGASNCWTRNRLQSLLPALVSARFNFATIIFERSDLTSFPCSVWYSAVCSSADEIVSLSHFSSSTQAIKCTSFRLRSLHTPSHRSLFAARCILLIYFLFLSAATWMMRSYSRNFVEQRDNTSVVDGDGVDLAAVTNLLNSFCTHPHVRDSKQMRFLLNGEPNGDLNGSGRMSFRGKNVQSRFDYYLSMNSSCVSWVYILFRVFGKGDDGGAENPIEEFLQNRIKHKSNLLTSTEEPLIGMTTIFAKECNHPSVIVAGFRLIIPFRINSLYHIIPSKMPQAPHHLSHRSECNSLGLLEALGIFECIEILIE